MCGRCRRPVSVCYCAALPRLETTTKIVILQHPRERDVPIGTARMASLCLPQATLHVGIEWSESAPLAHALGDPARPPILLYPGPGARDILSDPPSGPVTLVVVDGTWSQAKTVVRDNPVLQALPRYAFATPEPSQYRIRKEPRAELCSTIEALMHVLGVLEADPARFRALLDPFRAMVDAQLAAQARSPMRRIRQPRAPHPPGHKLPPAVLDRFEDLLCLVGEANAWPYAAGQHSPPDELVHLVAYRMGSGEMFDVIAAPGLELSPSTCFHSGLPENQLRRGRSLASLVEQFARFVRPTDIVCAWGHYGPGLVAGAGGTLPDARIDLRAAAQRFTSRKIGSLESYAASIAPTTPLADGRAGRRIAMLVAILDAWRASVAPAAT